MNKGDVSKEMTARKKKYSSKILEAFDYLREFRTKKNWTKTEIDTFKSEQRNSLTELFDNTDQTIEELEKQVQCICQLDYSDALEALKKYKEKDSVFNHFSNLLVSIVEKLRTATISKKAIDTIFNLKQQIVFFVTDENFNIRFLNEVGEQIFDKKIAQILGRNLFDFFPDLGKKEIDFSRKESIVQLPCEFEMGDAGTKKVEFSFEKIESTDANNEIAEFVFIFDFNTLISKLERSLIEDYPLLDNMIYGLNDIRKGSEDMQVIAKSSQLLRRLYGVREKVKAQLVTQMIEGKEAEEVDFELIHLQLLEEIRHLPNFGKMLVTYQNSKEKPFLADYETIFMLINRLVTNGIKFKNTSKKKGMVSVEIKDTLEGTAIIVKDNGIGIMEEHYNAIFEKQFKIENQFSDGLGMGLFFVKQKVEALGGNVKVQSIFGIESIFTVYLPF